MLMTAAGTITPAKVLVLGVFPRYTKRPDKTVTRLSAEELNPKIKQINAILAKMDDGKSVFYKDIGEKFLDKDGGLNPNVDLEKARAELLQHTQARGNLIAGERGEDVSILVYLDVPGDILRLEPVPDEVARL